MNYEWDYVLKINRSAGIVGWSPRLSGERVQHVYKLVEGCGEWSVKPSIDVKGLWYIRKRGTIYPRETGHPVPTFARLYTYSKAKTMSGNTYGRYLNGGANV